jgi:GGDEF domain-containing protein
LERIVSESKIFDEPSRSFCSAAFMLYSTLRPRQLTPMQGSLILGLHTALLADFCCLGKVLVNELTEPIYPSVQHGSATRLYSAGDPHRLPVTKIHFALFAYACAGLIAVHLLVIAFGLRYADSLIYCIWAAALFTYGSIAFMQARSTRGALSLRWLFFALSLGMMCLNYPRAAVGLVLGWEVTRFGPALLAASATLLLVAITLSSDSRSRGERALNISVAVAFFALRFFFELGLSANGSLTSAGYLHYTFDPLVELAVALVALAASPRNERRFYKNISLYLAADFFAGVCVNQLSLLGKHHPNPSPWSLTETLVPLAAGVYLLGNLTTTHAESRIQFRESGRPALHTLVPYAMNALIACMSIVLLPTHHNIGRAGIAFSVVALFARIAFTARSQSSVEQSLRYALRNQSWQDGPDPLSKVEVESDFGPALWEARASVGRETPLSLLMLNVAEFADDINVVQSNLEGDYLIEVARHLCQWRPTYATLYYLGQSRFAMLLPATSNRGARSLANQICTGIEALGLTGRRGFVKLSVGSATAVVLPEADRLVEAANLNLSRPKFRLPGFFGLRSRESASLDV